MTDVLPWAVPGFQVHRPSQGPVGACIWEVIRVSGAAPAGGSSRAGGMTGSPTQPFCHLLPSHAMIGPSYYQFTSTMLTLPVLTYQAASGKFILDVYGRQMLAAFSIATRSALHSERTHAGE